MFRFSASKNTLQAEALQDVLKNWGKLALAGIFVAGSLALPHAFAEPGKIAYQAPNQGIHGQLLAKKDKDVWKNNRTFDNDDRILSRDAGTAVLGDRERERLRDWLSSRNRYSTGDALSDALRRVLGSGGYYGNTSGQGASSGLPPGISKKIARGGQLPPGIANQVASGKRQLSAEDLYNLRRSYAGGLRNLDRGVLGNVGSLPYDLQQAIRDALGVPDRDFSNYRDMNVGVLNGNAVLYNPVTGVLLDILRNLPL